MKVIVREAGFYAGVWHDAGAQPQEMATAVAMQFLPPHGDQLALPKAEKTPAPKTDEHKGS